MLEAWSSTPSMDGVFLILKEYFSQLPIGLKYQFGKISYKFLLKGTPGRAWCSGICNNQLKILQLDASC